MDDAGNTTGSCRQHKSCTLPSHGLSAITCSLQLTTFCLHRVVQWMEATKVWLCILPHYSTTPNDSTTMQVNNCRRHWIGAVPVLLTNPTCQPMDHQHRCFAHPMGHSMGPGLLCCYVHVFSASLLAQHHPMGKFAPCSAGFRFLSFGFYTNLKRRLEFVVILFPFTSENSWNLNSSRVRCGVAHRWMMPSSIWRIRKNYQMTPSSFKHSLRTPWFVGLFFKILVVW